MNQITSFFDYSKGVLSSGGVTLEEIARSVGTPTYVYSADAFLKPFETLKRGLRGLDHLICFALKSNSNLSVVKLLCDAGAGMDVVSGGELYRAKAAKVPAEKIVFSGVGKTPDEMTSALKMDGAGIFSFNVESLAELGSLNQVAVSLGLRARVALRFNPDVNPKTHPYISTGLKKNKFGMRRLEILQIVRDLRRYPAIELKGISIHIGSQLLSLSPLNDAFARLRNLLEEIAPLLPYPLQFVDLGGGVGIQYKNEKPPQIEEYCRLVQKHFRKLPVKILLEPGRLLSGNAGILLTRCVFRKEGPRKDFLIVDAGMNDLIRPALYGSYHHILPVLKKRGGELKKTDLVGPVCESADCFSSEVQLSTLLQSGDLVALLSAGAYGFSMACNYNSRTRPAEVLIQNREFKVIRRRETYEDLIRGEFISE